MKKALIILATAVIAVACQKNGETSYDKDETFQEIASAVISNVIEPTYKNLAEETTNLADLLEEFKTNKTQNKLNEICTSFLKARAHWELSEAFLEGPATDLGVDKHIDSWPLDETAFNNLMASPKMIQELGKEDGDLYAGNNLGSALLGFHGIEYIIFKDGNPKDVSLVTDDQIIYAAAVAGDLRNRTYQLYVAWNGETSPAAWIAQLEYAELDYTVPGSDYSYGEMVLNAGKAGSVLKSKTHAMQYLLDGCVTIADEVGTSKIGKPYSGEDVTYIESPYSWNSITDFYDNIVSIKNVWAKFNSYFKSQEPTVAASVNESISNALEMIDEMKYPFVNNINDPTVREARDACIELSSALAEAKSEIAR